MDDGARIAALEGLVAQLLAANAQQPAALGGQLDVVQLAVAIKDAVQPAPPTVEERAASKAAQQLKVAEKLPSPGGEEYLFDLVERRIPFLAAAAEPRPFKSSALAGDNPVGGVDLEAWQVAGESAYVSGGRSPAVMKSSFPHEGPGLWTICTVLHAYLSSRRPSLVKACAAVEGLDPVGPLTAEQEAIPVVSTLGEVLREYHSLNAAFFVAMMRLQEVKGRVMNQDPNLTAEVRARARDQEGLNALRSMTINGLRDPTLTKDQRARFVAQMKAREEALLKQQAKSGSGSK